MLPRTLHARRRRIRALRIAATLSLGLACGATHAAPDTPSAAARRVAEGIRREALRPPRGPGGRPLPLASHWNVGTVEGTFEPGHQIALLQEGHHVLPWMAWPRGDPESERFAAYHGRLLRYCAALDLPVSFRGTQWSAMLVGKAYRDGPLERWTGVVTPDGKRVPRLSPFGPLDPWKDPAAEYVDTPAVRAAQRIYPDPPLVLFVSNNEPPDLRWAKHGPLEERSGRYLERYGEGRPGEFRRRVVGEGWIERYRVLFGAMKEALVEDAWRRNVRFVGYGAFGPPHLGRWEGWKVYSLACEAWTDPAWHVWDGGSPSYYTHNWSPVRDHHVFSTQVGAMNWVFMLEEAWSVEPGFWFEISTWDGNDVGAWMEGLGVERPGELAERSAEGLSPAERERIDPELMAKSKTLRYIADGQTYPPERTEGWVQFGLWLVRPRVVREFRSHATQRAPVLPYWRATVRAVDRVWRDETLVRFWRHGDLVPNTAREHPYRAALPERYRSVDRWYLLDTSLDPARPWDLETSIPVFSLALRHEDASGSGEWLLYAHAPLGAKRDVEITLPGRGDVTVDVPRAGAFWHIVADEGPRRLGVP